MKDINLIPPEAVQSRRTHVRLRMWIAIHVAVVGVLALIFGIASWSASTQETAVWKLDSRLAELRSLTEDLEALRAERARLGKEERALAVLVDRVPDCSLMRTIAEVVTHKGWFTEVDLGRPVGGEEKKGKPGLLMLEGYAGSFNHLGRLMRDLDALESIDRVDLRKSQRSRVDDLEVIQFELECQLAAGL